MAEPLKMPGAAPQVGMVLIRGRVEDYRDHEGFIFTVIAMPAPDEYSMPGVVEVRSRNTLGPVGAPIEVTCKVSGYPGKPFRVTDERTGRDKQVRRTIITLDAVN